MAGKIPRVTLEQWAILQAVVAEGSFAQAAEALGKSQSSISYALKGLQQQLPVEVLSVQGRKAELTTAGAALLRRAEALLDDARSLERAALSLSQGWEAEVRLAVEIVFPSRRVLDALSRFAATSPPCRIQLIESVLSGTHEALLNRDADLVIIDRIPPGFLGQPLMSLDFIAVAHSQHPLHRIDRLLTMADLQNHRQLVIRDTGLKRKQDAGWLGAEQRWTVSHLKTSIQAVKQGLGFAWFPREQIESELEDGSLKPLRLAEGGNRREQFYLVYADRDSAGPAVQALAATLLEVCATANAGQRQSAIV